MLFCTCTHCRHLSEWSESFDPGITPLERVERQRPRSWPLPTLDASVVRPAHLLYPKTSRIRFQLDTRYIVTMETPNLSVLKGDMKRAKELWKNDKENKDLRKKFKHAKKRYKEAKATVEGVSAEDQQKESLNTKKRSADDGTNGENE